MIYHIIKQLQQTSSTNEKLAIMEANKDNELLKEYMRLVTCPSVSFYITEKAFPVVTKTGAHTFQSLSAAGYTIGVEGLSQRHVTGQAAKNFIIATMEDLDEEHQELYKMLLLKDIRAKIGVTLVNKVWPSLCVDIPYMRCSLPNEKNLNKFKEAETFIVQTKGDGMFASLVLDNNNWNEDVSLYTRNGNKFPQWMAEYISEGLNDTQAVYEGELLCFRKDKMLSRKEGNGILNSIMQGGELPEDVSVQYHVWNRLPLEDWKGGVASHNYQVCFSSLVSMLHVNNPKQISVIDYEVVETLEQAYAFNQQQLAKGLEGSIIKTLTHKWKNGTSNECLKLKVEAEIDLFIYDVVEGKGKAQGMCGALRLHSSCGKLEVDVGTGMSDKHRKQYWEEKDTLIGRVVAIKANDLLSKEGSETMSLFLPVLIEIRTDKTEADSLERIEQIFEAIKLGKA